MCAGVYICECVHMCVMGVRAHVHMCARVSVCARGCLYVSVSIYV